MPDLEHHRAKRDTEKTPAPFGMDSETRVLAAVLETCDDAGALLDALEAHLA